MEPKQMIVKTYLTLAFFNLEQPKTKRFAMIISHKHLYKVYNVIYLLQYSSWIQKQKRKPFKVEKHKYLWIEYKINICTYITVIYKIINTLQRSKIW